MDCVTTPTLKVRPPAKPRATGLGTKPSVAIAWSTAWRLSSLTTAVPLRMRDTVLGETPAACATISRVTLSSPRAAAAAALLPRVATFAAVFFFMPESLAVALEV